MEKLPLLQRARKGLHRLIPAGVLLFLAWVPIATAEESKGDLAEQVAHLAQECQNGENLTAEQLLEVVGHADSLDQTVMQSGHPQKKLLLIRIKKTRNLCLYLLQLKQSD